jgi:hypothetical protein
MHAMNDLNSLGMANTRRTRVTIVDAAAGLDASRRVAWARFYEEADRASQLSQANAMLRERLAILIPILYDLIDSVLSKRNMDAFAEAYRIKGIIEDYLERDARGDE